MIKHNFQFLFEVVFQKTHSFVLKPVDQLIDQPVNIENKWALKKEQPLPTRFYEDEVELWLNGGLETFLLWLFRGSPKFPIFHGLKRGYPALAKQLRSANPPP